MDCAGVAGHLVGYHVGAVSDDDREALEAHLLVCTACLKTYFSLKRAADRAGAKGAHERPRPEVKARLRAEVARAFPPRSKERPMAMTRPRPTLAVFARRIPLYQGVALAALAAAVALAAPSVLRRASRSEPTAGVPTIDSSRTRAESLHIY